MYALFRSQFDFCPLVWMCCNRSLNTKIKWLHERCLWVVHNDKKSNFNELLVKDGSISIHHEHMQKLTEMCKVSRGLSPEIVNELFQFSEQILYKLRKNTQFQIPWVYAKC